MAQLAHYQIKELLGEGAFARVYRAFDTNLERPVALKVLKQVWLEDQQAVNRFMHEAKTMARLHHPNIVSVYDVGTVGGQIYLAQHLVEGKTLAQALQQQRFSWNDTLDILRQVASALDYAHTQGVIHRDIKPSNILLASNGTAYIGDFGLVRAAEGSVVLSTSAGGMVGTPAYMAPEQWEGHEPTQATDVYALACVATEMLTGRVLFDGPTPAAVMKQHLINGPQFPPTWPSDVPDGVTQVLASGLAAESAYRIQSAGKFVTQLRHVNTAATTPERAAAGPESRPVLSRTAPQPLPPKPTPPQKSSSLVVMFLLMGVVAGIILLVVGLAGVWFFGWDRIISGRGAVVQVTATPLATPPPPATPIPQATSTPAVATPIPQPPTATSKPTASSDTIPSPQQEQVRLDTIISAEPTLDPATASDLASTFLVRQMFVGLTTFDADGNVQPELATTWEVSDDGLTWIFKLRDDIWWVRRNNASGEYSRIGPVTAFDVEYGIKRSLDPNTGAAYAYVLYGIKGADTFNNAAPDASNLNSLRNAVGVKAINETTVQFLLTEPAAYFPAIMGVWVSYPQPQQTIEESGDTWTEPGSIVTSGPYALHTWEHEAELFLEKNPVWPNADQVQIDLFGGPIVRDDSGLLMAYENNEIDMMAAPGWDVPPNERDRVKADPQLSRELYVVPRSCTYYYGFINTQPPFDDSRVRKAFSLAIDRSSLIENITVPSLAHTFVPPGIFGNVADDFSVGGELVASNYNQQLDLARQLVAEAGYPEGEGLDIVVGYNTGEVHALIAETVVAGWQQAFPNAQITINAQEWAEYLSALMPGSPDDAKPNIFRLSWCPDYPDSNNWLYDVFHSNSGQNYAKYSNSEFDSLVERARRQTDPATRQALYKQAESLLIDQDAAIAPIYYYNWVRLYKPWIEPVFSAFTGDPVALWKLDWDAKKAARGD